MHDAHSNMRMHHSGVNSREPSIADQSSFKPAVTFVLPMYAVGIAVFFIYTFFKVGSKWFFLYYELYHHLFSIGEEEITMKLRSISGILLLILIGVVTKRNLNIGNLIVIMTMVMMMKIYMLVLFYRIIFQSNDN